MNILFITATRLGDAVLSTGLLEHLRVTYPSARFTIACGPVAAGLFAHLPQRVRTIIVEKRRYDLHWFDLWRQCVKTRWDLVVDLRGSGLSFFLWSRKRAIMRGGRRPGARIGHLAQVLKLMDPPLPTVWLDDNDRAFAHTMLKRVEGRKLIALAPTANWSGKIWPAEKFQQTFDAIRKVHQDAVPVVFYGPGDYERQHAAPLLDTLPEAIDAGGDYSLTQVGAMLTLCSAFIGNDSGLMHLSAACGTPTLGLFGPSRVSEYAPVGMRTDFVVAPGDAGRAPIEGLDVATVSTRALGLLHV